VNDRGAVKICFAARTGQKHNSSFMFLDQRLDSFLFLDLRLLKALDLCLSSSRDASDNQVLSVPGHQTSHRITNSDAPGRNLIANANEMNNLKKHQKKRHIPAVYLYQTSGVRVRRCLARRGEAVVAVALRESDTL
jgi:hypothetical protein